CHCKVETAGLTDRFVVETNQGTMRAESLVVATGGLSFAKLGATDFGHRIAKQFGLRLTSLRPGLVPLLCPQPEFAKYRALSGVSLPVRCSVDGTAFDDSLLFTHRGVSGPATLQISSF